VIRLQSIVTRPGELPGLITPPTQTLPEVLITPPLPLRTPRMETTSFGRFLALEGTRSLPVSDVEGALNRRSPMATKKDRQCVCSLNFFELKFGI
jgi:hypothetical protein